MANTFGLSGNIISISDLRLKRAERSASF